MDGSDSNSDDNDDPKPDAKVRRDMLRIRHTVVFLFINQPTNQRINNNPNNKMSTHK